MTTTSSQSSAAVLPAGRSLEAVGGDDAAMRGWAEELVARARREGVELTGDNGLLTDLVRQVLQTGLEVEMTDHLGYEPHAVEGRGSGNSRNGSYPKTVTTDVGKVGLRVPRDRNASFEPATVPKGRRRLDGLSTQVISLYAKGMSTGDIQAHLAEMYGTDISRDTISRITDAVVEDLQAWQNRPLDRIYPVLLIDAINVKTETARWPIGPCTWPWASIWTASVTCWACGLGRAEGRAPSSHSGSTVRNPPAMRVAGPIDMRRFCPWDSLVVPLRPST